MNQERVKEFQNRIVNAGRGELLIINYEMLIAEIEEAKEALESKSIGVFQKAMLNTHRLLRELTSSLDFKYDLSKDLMSLYVYINKKLVEASTKRSLEDLKEAERLLDVLLSGWKLTEFTESEPVVANGQKVYAGLTYGKGMLKEIRTEEESRGYKA